MGELHGEWLSLRRKHVPRGAFNIFPLFIQRAQGALLVDVEGRTYIDFTGGIGSANVGHGVSEVVSAVQEQAGKFLHACFHVAMYEPYVELARRLNEITPGDFSKKTFFVNSGAEAVENAVKIARAATHRHAMIAFENAFHGRTYMALTLTGRTRPYKRGFGPFCPEVYRMPFAYCYRCAFDLEYPSCRIHCVEALEDFFVAHVSADDVAALIVEPVQGEGGFVVPPKEYLLKLQEVCRRHGMLLILDEIQTGMGRTGRLYAAEHFGIEPDLILTGKALAAGLPLAAVTGRAEVMDAPPSGGLGGTFGGNPVACAAALAVLDLLDEAFLERARRLGEIIRSRFEDFQKHYEMVGDVRGLGAMVGMELVRDHDTKEPAGKETVELRRRCMEKGLLILSCGAHNNVIRTLMPLTITDDQLEEGLALLEEALWEISEGRR